MMTNAMPFGEVLEAAGQLSPDDQQTLIDILNRRLALENRRQIVADVQDGRKQFAEGQCKPVTVDQLMREILE